MTRTLGPIDEVPPGPYLVLGCGRAGVSAAEALAPLAGPSGVTVWDEDDGPQVRLNGDRMAARGVSVVVGPWSADALDRIAPGTVVKSPGVPPLSPPVEDARRRGILVIDELDLGRRLSRRPLVAVTGTDGKSTVCALLASALGDDDEPLPIAGNTAFGVALSALPRTGGRAIVEASSYQLEFCATPFAELAVLTNVTVEHLHRHGTMRDYQAAKRRLFLGGSVAVPLAVINVDGPFGRALAGELRAAGTTVAGHGSGPHADYRVLEASWDTAGASVRVATPGGEVTIGTRLPGPHNAENAIAALAACDLLGVPRPRALASLRAATGVPGRWEHVRAGQPFDVIVDFAHTPAALQSVLLTARAAVAQRAGARVHVVLCAGGGNNPGKRYPFGRIASRLADHVVVTEGNGRGEPREQVIATILAGADPHGATLEVVPDRRAAIRQALGGARPGDVVLITGRGAMPRLLASRAGDGPAFDDRDVARDELVKLAALEPVSA